MSRSANSPLLLSYEFPPRVYGGLGRHVEGLAAALARRGASVGVATLGVAGLPRDERGAVHVRRTAAVPAVGEGSDWLASVLAFDTVLAAAAAPLADHADVVHAHDWLVGRTAIGLAETLGRPLVVTVHATERGRHQGWLPDAVSRFVDGFERWLATLAARVIVCSQAMRQAVAGQWDLDPARVTVIPNGVTRSTEPRAPEPGLVVFAGRLEHEKGGTVLLEALALLNRRKTPARLVVAGAGSQEDAWRRRAADLGVQDRTDFVGRVDGDRLRALYARAAAVVVPSLYEPFGMVAAEAMVAGAPLVASDVGGLPEVVGDGGRLVPPADAAALADALADLLTSPAASRRAETAASRRAEHLASWDDVAHRTAAAYEAASRQNRRHAWSG